MIIVKTTLWLSRSTYFFSENLIASYCTHASISNAEETSKTGNPAYLLVGSKCLSFYETTDKEEEEEKKKKKKNLGTVSWRPTTVK